MFVGWLGATELAAVGIATTAIFLINSFFLGTLRGVKVVSSQATGDTRTPMKVNLAANALNVALDPLLIFGWGPIPAMGVSGAAGC